MLACSMDIDHLYPAGGKASSERHITIDHSADQGTCMGSQCLMYSEDGPTFHGSGHCQSYPPALRGG